ncbi:MAG: hypothetical protein DRJ31_02080 [Candidatus Methanomethylicota archaeon]|uniref:Transglutaminase-like domain-containing protein n=1 Tax=Thermoproteota archaeon TaxID=2056631 RepID=A0A497ETI1_9CREN|nr:MAG: hypothetical protein DRJ31_02080 [Candidatus Verstraetearchaeota archaeon]
MKKNTLLTILILALLAAQFFTTTHAMTQLAQLSVRLEVAVNEISDLKGALQRHANEVKALNQTISSLSANISTVNQRLNSVEDVLANISISYSFLNLELQKLKENFSNFVKLYESLLQNYTALNQSYQELLENYTKLMSENKRLRQELELKLNQSEEYNRKLSDQLSEIAYFRSFKVYNYRLHSYKLIELKIAAQDYLHYRLNVTREYAVIEDRVERLRELFMDFVTYDDQYIKQIAEQLREISGLNDELYANLVLQIVHQINYARTLYCKYPVETIVENVGDCDNLAVLAASLMKAGGVDTALILCRVSSDGVNFFAHAMVGVALSSKPLTPLAYGRTPQYVSHEGKHYYLCECTYSRKASPWDLSVKGSLVGDNPWKAMKDIVILPV